MTFGQIIALLLQLATSGPQIVQAVERLLKIAERTGEMTPEEIAAVRANPVFNESHWQPKPPSP